MISSSECESVDSCNVNGSKVKVTSVSTCASSDVCNVDSHWSKLKLCTEEEGSELMTELTAIVSKKLATRSHMSNWGEPEQAPH